MFKIYDGRDWLYQWDLNRKLRVSDPSVTQVHFSNRKRDTALVLEVYEHEGIRVADIPNILLQDCCPLVAYAYLDEHTRKSFAFDVKRRPKPEEYKYTETEVLTFYTMMTRAENAAAGAEASRAAAEAVTNTATTAANAAIDAMAKAEKAAQAAQDSAQEAKEAAENGGGVKVTAEVGQTILVTEVDANGKPTKWEAADYQPRTHWLEGREVLPETMCGLPHEDSDTTDGGVAILSNHIGLVEGESYKVTYTTEVNGTREYTCVCKKYTNVDGDWLYPGDWLYLGNGIIIGGNSEYTKDPFTIAEYPNAIAEYPNGMTWCVTSYPGTLSVCTSNYQLHKLPVEFLPDGVPYLAESEKAEILPETQLIVDDNDSSEYYFMEVVTAPIVGGDTYIVSYNGVEYPCAAVEMTEEGMTAYIFGNYALMSGAGDTGEPFIAIVLPAEYAAAMGVGGMVMSIDGSTPVTIGISGSSREVRKLDNRCLDLEWIPTKQSAGIVLIPEVTASGTGYVKGIGSRDFLPYDRVIVVFDGVEYECYPQFSDDGNIKDAFMTISNVPDASLMPGENPDQKFLIFGVSGQTSLIPSDGGTHTYLVKTAEYDYNKLDNGYLNLDWLPVRGTKEIFRPTVFKHNKATYGGTIFDLKSIIVIYEGVRYSCPVRFETAEEAAEAADVCSAGNHLFALWSLRGGSSVYAYFADGKDHFLSILDGESYNKLPEGYLPESVEGVIIRSSTEGSSKKFKLTVDDSGTITATEVT